MGALVLFPGEERFFNSLRTSVRAGRKVEEVISVLGCGWHSEVVPLADLILPLENMTALTPAAQDRTSGSFVSHGHGEVQQGRYSRYSFSSSLHVTPCHHADHSSHSVILLLLVHLSYFLSLVRPGWTECHCVWVHILFVLFASWIQFCHMHHRLNTFTCWFQKTEKVKRSLKFNYRLRVWLKQRVLVNVLAVIFIISFLLLEKNQQYIFTSFFSLSIFFPCGLVIFWLFS